MKILSTYHQEEMQWRQWSFVWCTVPEVLLTGIWFSCFLGICGLHPRFVQRLRTSLSGWAMCCIVTQNSGVFLFNISKLSCLRLSPSNSWGWSLAVISPLHTRSDEMHLESLWYSWISFPSTCLSRNLPFLTFCISVGFKCTVLYFRKFYSTFQKKIECYLEFQLNRKT